MEYNTKPKDDFAVKELLEHEEIRNNLISDILDIPLSSIRSTRIMNSFLRKLFKKEKQGILGVKMEMNNDTKMNLEIQIGICKHWRKRKLFYLSKLYIEDLIVGEDYSKLKRCISISILDFNLTEDAEYHSVYKLRDQSGRLFSDLLELHVIELRKKIEGDRRIDDWIRFFNVKSEEDAKMIQTKNKGVLAALEELKTMNLPRAARDIYEEIMKEKRDKRAREEYVWDEGKAEGITKVKLLIQKLAEAGREDDIIKFATDEEYLKKLLKEFNI